MVTVSMVMNANTETRYTASVRSLCTTNREEPLLATSRECLHAATKTQCSQILKNKQSLKMAPLFQKNYRDKNTN